MPTPCQDQTRFPCIALSAVKHAYIARGVASHPRFEIVAVADDADVPEWAHARNQHLADEFQVPYYRGLEEGIRQSAAQVAVVSSEAERHCDLSIRAADAGLHVIQDKPMSNRMAECDRLVEAIERNDVRFLMWNRNGWPAVRHATDIVRAGKVGEVVAVHVDFYFAKDCGLPLGHRRGGDPPIHWLDHQLAAHADGSDGGLGVGPMGELQVEGIYPLGYVHAMIGHPVERVFARTSAHFHQLHADNDVEDLASVSFELTNGVVGSLCLGRIGAASHPNIGEIKIHVVGTAGALVINEPRPEVGVYYRDQPPFEFRGVQAGNENDFHLMEDFAQAIDDHRSTCFDVRVGRAIAATVDAAMLSGRSGRVEFVRHL